MLPSLLAALCLPSWAQPGDPCKKQDNTLEINACAAHVLKQKDAELNQAYQDLLKTLKPADKNDRTDYTAIRKELAEAQRAWITFRDRDCGATYKYWEEGSIRGIKYLACLTDRTEQRTRELRKWAAI